MRDRLTLIIAITALVVAVLGATPFGEAAYNAVVPSNSVGSAQLRNGAVTEAKLRGDAVTSGKVKNRSLKAIDFATGQIPAGPAGPKGDKGDKRQQGRHGAERRVFGRFARPIGIPCRNANSGGDAANPRRGQIPALGEELAQQTTSRAADTVHVFSRCGRGEGPQLRECSYRTAADNDKHPRDRGQGGNDSQPQLHRLGRGNGEQLEDRRDQGREPDNQHRLEAAATLSRSARSAGSGSSGEERRKARRVAGLPESAVYPSTALSATGSSNHLFKREPGAQSSCCTRARNQGHSSGQVATRGPPIRALRPSESAFACRSDR